MKKMSADFLRPYSQAQIGDILTLALEMRTWALTPDDVIAAVNDYFEAVVARHGVKEQAPDVAAVPAGKKKALAVDCPQCGGSVAVSPVNVSRCTAVGGEWHTSLQCSNPQCRFTELSTKTLLEWRTT